ncbi:hypothetical protein SARC_01484 [Sphaeroforma arctica JP610]|uniref:Uncharacterized protein n=1 Tax=Sphaeroforma arctica JP610 TaxID=667725 RepID=A0A0L0GBV5_9EUKA|nr:hypothetical protein SARC_01484 [Sphaeroforma arctica JP610]KNC86389.1 hypothetical protein SARC_01484 [Sphaeroforma arctica JP610]|eukprot:XP_014160291.1 hypothetical protein SARC_01484 [Sphaeroforma arctica JP610]
MTPRGDTGLFGEDIVYDSESIGVPDLRADRNQINTREYVASNGLPSCSSSGTFGASYSDNDQPRLPPNKRRRHRRRTNNKGTARDQSSAQKLTGLMVQQQSLLEKYEQRLQRISSERYTTLLSATETSAGTHKRAHKSLGNEDNPTLRIQGRTRPHRGLGYVSPGSEGQLSEEEELHARILHLSDELCQAIEDNDTTRAEALRGAIETLRATQESQPVEKRPTPSPRTWPDWPSNRYHLHDIMERDTRGALLEAFKNAQIAGSARMKRKPLSIPHFVSWPRATVGTCIPHHGTNDTASGNHRRARERCQADADFQQNLLNHCIVQLFEEALNGRTYEHTLQLLPKWQLMKTHELLQLLSPDIQNAQQHTTARLQNRTNREGLTSNVARDYTNSRPNPQTIRRQSQNWTQRPQPTPPTTCAGCQAQAPPGSRHIPRCHHFRASQPGGIYGGARPYDNNRPSRDAQPAHRPTAAPTSGQGQNNTPGREFATTRPTPQVYR